MPSTSARATSSGARATGIANSIGTKTAWVGTVKPEPTSIRTCTGGGQRQHVQGGDRQRERASAGPVQRDGEGGAEEATPDG